MYRFTRAAAIAVALLCAAIPAPAMAHEDREVGEFLLVVGFIDEPVFVGSKSGLEFFVSREEEPIEGLEASLRAEVIYQGQTRELTISPRFGEPGAYESVFFPTAAGAYTFRLYGDVDGTEIDESFTSGPEGFNEVQEASSAQFPVQFPAQAELAATAASGGGAATMALMALIVAGVAAVLGLVALGMALGARRRGG